MYLISIRTSIILVVIVIQYCDATETQTFKISKLNIIWTKAQQTLGPDKLKDLKNDLSAHELEELNLKKMKAHNQDKDGLFEAVVRKKLLTIMSKYSLERYYDDIHTPYDKTASDEKSIQGGSVSELKNDNGDQHVIFRDSKLDKLWKKAEKSGFTQEQLMVLHEKFLHQQDKIDKHYDSMSKIEEAIDKSSTKSENSLDYEPVNDDSKRKFKSRKEDLGDKKLRLDSNIHQNLKDKYAGLKKGYEILNEKINGRPIDEKRPFEEEPVNELWNSALRSSFSEEELESLKEELQHYETRIKKLKHYQYQLERDTFASKDSKSYGEDSDETKHIKRRVEELSDKVSKSHRSFQKMIKKNEREEL